MSATAKLFMHGRSQAVRLPKEFRLPGTEVRVSGSATRCSWSRSKAETVRRRTRSGRSSMRSARGISCRTASPTIRRSSRKMFRSITPVFCLDTNAVVFALNRRRPAIAARIAVGAFSENVADRAGGGDVRA